MKKRMHILVCWLLTLSLTGLPVFSIAASSHRPLSPAAIRLVATSAQQDNAPITLNNLYSTKFLKPGCGYGGDKCTGISITLGHYSNNQQTAAIFQHMQPAQIIQSPSGTTAFYHDRDVEPEIVFHRVRLLQEPRLYDALTIYARDHIQDFKQKTLTTIF